MLDMGRMDLCQAFASGRFAIWRRSLTRDEGSEILEWFYGKHGVNPALGVDSASIVAVILTVFNRHTLAIGHGAEGYT